MSQVSRGVVGIVLCLSLASASQALDTTKILTFCESKLNKRVGSGECAHLATEALRYAGAEFMRNGMADFPATGDYTWGTLVKELRKNSAGKVTDSKTSNKCRPGDIIQYRLGASSSGSKTHHTSIVATVDSAGYPTSIYEQNVSGQRFVVKNSTNLFTKLKERGGYLRIFRAKAPVDPSRTEFTLVNNAQQSNVAYLLNGNSKTIGPMNSINGFNTWWNTSSTVKIKVGANTYTISKRKGYEFYKSGNTIKLRVLSM